MISGGNPMKTRLFFSRCDLGAKKAGEQARCRGPVLGQNKPLG